MEEKISFIEVFGERNSGTNYLRKLLKTNLEKIDFSLIGKVGWKHADCHDAGNNGLIIVIYRNPITWLQAMYRAPHHAPQLRKLSFSDFLLSEWRTYFEKNPNERLHTGNKKQVEYFKNIFDLRKKKIALFETFKHRLPNVCYINYEMLATKPLAVIRQIADIYYLKTKNTVKNFTKYKDTEQVYKKRKYQPIAFRDFEKIIHSLDWEKENKIGYDLRSDSKLLLLCQTLSNKITKDWHPLLKYEFCLRGIFRGRAIDKIEMVR